MRKLLLFLTSIILLFILLSSFSIWRAVTAQEWRWLIIIPLALMIGIGVILFFGLKGGRGGLLAFLSGQLSPEPKNLPRNIHLEVDSLTSIAMLEAYVDLEHPITKVSGRYLSFAVDLSQVVGGKWWNPLADHVEFGSGSYYTPQFDFERPRLNSLFRALSPCYLRIGGSEADKVFYALDNDPEIPPGYQSVLSRSQWDCAVAFAERNDAQLMFTLNTGPAARQKNGDWNPDNAQALMVYAARVGHQVAVWELGNELNMFFAVHGLRSQVSVERHCRDLLVLRRLIDQEFPTSRLSSQGSAYMPVLGEPLGYFMGFTEKYLKLADGLPDIFTWHYYPQQSRRAPIASRRAAPARLLSPANLDEAAYWANKINSQRDHFNPGLPVWLGETGNAQCGGEPGISDAYIAGLWWLDQLGLMARLKQEVVVRQSLTGVDYGLLDEETLIPRPDYWNSLLWKRLMGEIVYDARLADKKMEKLRLYAHSDPAGDGISLLAINLDHQQSVFLMLPQFVKRPFSRYILTSPDVLSDEVRLNGKTLGLDEQGSLPEIRSELCKPGETPGLSLPPLSYGFVAFHHLFS